VKARPEAAVKGITPTQPAPISQPRPARTEKVQAESSGGFFGFIKKMFSSSPAAEEKPAPSNARGRNQGRNGNGGDRNRGRNRRGERNGERAERPAVTAAEGTTEANNNRNGNRNQGNNRNGNRNGPKPERQANPPAVTPATEAAPGEAAPTADGEERRGRGRNRRGRGRNRNDRGERAENGEVSTSAIAMTSASPFSGPPVGMAGASASMPIQNLANSFGNAKPAAQRQERAPRPPRQSNRPAQSTPAAAPVVAVAVAAVSAVEVIAKPAPELPKVAFQALEETPLHSVVQSAGMIWVATDASKHAEAQSQIQPESTNLGRAPKPAAARPEGPMVLVETGGQEKTV
jgi:ribonuclease E